MWIGIGELNLALEVKQLMNRLEIWGNELAPANLNSGGWDQIFHNVDHGVDQNGIDLGFSGGISHHQ